MTATTGTATGRRPGLTVGAECRDGLGTAYRPLRYLSPDGLTLAGRDYGVAVPGRLPVLCLPGLTRNSRDFEPVTARFAAERRIVTLDLRGRGESEYTGDAARYQPSDEAADVARGIDLIGLGPSVMFGTSRGGIVTFLLALTRPETIAAAIFNDVGPQLERDGIMRIRGYVGTGEIPADWDGAVALLKVMVGDQFPALDDAAWMRKARRVFRTVGGRPVTDYDPALGRTLDAFGPDTPLPTFWPCYEALRGKPLMLLHGASSDILSDATVGRMAELRPDLDVVVVPGQGHAPVLEDAFSLDRIAAFLRRCDAGIGAA